MVTLPPEYAITKLGMSHSLPRKRDKPLRTYGKRSAPAPESPIEPPSKRLHLTAEAPPRWRRAQGAREQDQS
ncbi:hypothetical protein CDD83_4206 [Cordyceps sp. RAO-2017]|nr:hypothetical protein CDD83_4206 [Cordyceps sp. RAO-2017]